MKILLHHDTRPNIAHLRVASIGSSDFLVIRVTSLCEAFVRLVGDVPRSASYGVYISQLIRFARVSSQVDDFNTRNKVLTAKLLRQGYRYH